MYKHLKYESTKDMSREAWLESRRKAIGGSDAGAILGLSPYNSPYALWAEKTGKYIPEDITDKESVRLGNDLEQYVAERFCEATGKKVRRCNSIITNPDMPFAHANVDRLVVGEDAGLECKTTSSYDIAAKLAAGEIPETWYCQMTHYMMVTGAARWYLGALVFGRGFYHFTVERSEEEIAALRKAEEDFWQMVQDGVQPSVDGTQATTAAVNTIFRESAAGSSIDLAFVGASIDLYNSLTAQIKQLEADRAEAENAIKGFMGSAERGSYGNCSVSWKSGKRRTFDKTAYEAENGRIADKFYKTTEARTFRVTNRKDV